MSSTEAFQIPLEAAEAYESAFVPRLFGEWAGWLVEAADVAPGQSVLDVACGTGVVARAAADRMKQRGTVVGLDLNEAMLTVARRLRPELEWRQGDAAQLPFAEGSFDVVLCQSGLMFFPDVPQALREMARVVTDDGTVAVQVWDRRESQPGYRPLIEVAARHAGPDAINLLSTYFVLGDLDGFAGIAASAGLEVTATQTRTSTMRFTSVDELVAVEVQSTPLGERLSEEALRRIVGDAREALAPFATDDGRLDMPIRGHVILARKR